MLWYDKDKKDGSDRTVASTEGQGEMNMNTGERIKQARLAAGLTQTELAEKIGVKFSAVHKYESGRVVNLKRETLTAIAKALNVTESWLLCLDEEELRLPPAPPPRDIDLIYDALWEECNTEEELPEDIIDSILDHSIPVDQRKCKTRKKQHHKNHSQSDCFSRIFSNKRFL